MVIILIYFLFAGIGLEASEILLEHADRLETERKGERVYLYGSVSVKSGEIRIKSHTAKWDKSKRIIQFVQDVTIESPDYLIKSDAVLFDENKDIARTTQGRVLLEFKKRSGSASGNTGVLLKSDSIAIITGNASFTSLDTTDSGKVKVNAESLSYDFSRSVGKAFRHTKMTLEDRDGKINLIMNCDSMVYFGEGESLYAYGNITLEKDTLNANSEFLKYYRKNENILMCGKPTVWGKTQEIRGDTILAVFVEGELKYGFVFKDAITTWQSDSLHPERLSTFEAESVYFTFVSGAPEKIHLFGTVRSKYYPVERDTATTSLNAVRSDSALLVFNEGKLDSIYFWGSARGEFMRTEKGKPDSLFYEARTISYAPEQEEVMLLGDSYVRYHDFELKSHRVEYNLDSYILKAYGFTAGDSVLGKPVVKQGNDEFFADHIDYNIKSGKGHMYYGKSSSGEAYYSGDIVARAEKGDFYIKGGRYTTCEINSPHYHFYSPKIKMIRSERLVAKGVVLYIKDLPVFALPYIVFSLQKTRHSGFLPVDIGNFARGERFIRNIGYYYAPGPYWDGKIALDYDELTGWLFKGSVRYALKDYFSGEISGSYKFESSEALTSEHKYARWDISLNHSQNISSTSYLGLRGNFVSDKNYFYDTRYTPEERMTSTLNSDLVFYKNFEHSSFTITFSREYNIGTNTTRENLPSIRFTRYQQTLFRSGWLKNLNLSYSGYFLKRHETNPLFNHWVTTQELGLSFPVNIEPYVNISPGVNLRSYLYDSDKQGKYLPYYLTLSLNTNISTSIYGNIPMGILGIKTLRHILQPNINFSFQPPSKDYSNFYPVGGIAPYASRIKRLSYSVNNIFQLKLKQAESRINLASLTLSSGYNWENKLSPLEDIFTSLRIEPFAFLNVVLSSRFSWYKNQQKLDLPRFLDGSITSNAYIFGVQRWGKDEEGKTIRNWQINLSHYYSKRVSPDFESHWARLAISYFLTKNWKIDYSIYYDLKGNERVSENVTLWRDLHCWELMIGIIPSGIRAGFFVRINVKEIPDIKIEYGKGKVWGIF